MCLWFLGAKNIDDIYSFTKEMLKSYAFRLAKIFESTTVNFMSDLFEPFNVLHLDFLEKQNFARILFGLKINIREESRKRVFFCD